MTNRTAGLTLMDLILFLYTPCPPSVLSLGAPVFFPMCFSFFALLPVPSGGGRTRTKGVDVAPRPSTPPLKTGWAGSRGLLLKVSAFQHPGEPTLPQHYGQTILLTARGKHDPPPPRLQFWLSGKDPFVPHQTDTGGEQFQMFANLPKPAQSF